MKLKKLETAFGTVTIEYTPERKANKDVSVFESSDPAFFTASIELNGAIVSENATTSELDAVTYVLKTVAGIEAHRVMGIA